jgi:hypothetical protein
MHDAFATLLGWSEAEHGLASHRAVQNLCNSRSIVPYWQTSR